MNNQWKCTHCGQNNPGAMRFCPNCGRPRPTEDYAPTIVAPAPPSGGANEKPPGNRKMLVGAAIALWIAGMLVLAVGGVIWWKRSHNAEETAMQSTSATETAPQTSAVASAEPTPKDTPAPAPTFTPQPVWIAAYTDSNNNLWLLDAAEDEQKQLTNSEDIFGKLFWSPGGDFLLAGKTLINLTTQQVTELSDLATENSASFKGIFADIEDTFAWSADGKKLAYIAAFDTRGSDGNYIPVAIIDTETGNTESFTIEYRRDEARDDYFPIELFWQDDCCLFISIGWEALRGIQGNQVYRLTLPEGNVERVLDNFQYLNGFSVNPAADTLVFAGKRDDKLFISDIYALSLSSPEDPQRIAAIEGNNVKTHWLPDGSGFFAWSKAKDPHTLHEQRYILKFVTWPQAEVTLLGDVDASQGRLSDVTLAPTGQAAAFTLYRKDRDKTELYLLPAPQAEPQLLTSASGNTSFTYVWSADGLELWVVSPDAPEAAQIYDLQGEMIRETTTGRELALNPASPSSSAPLAEAAPTASPTPKKSASLSKIGSALAGGGALKLPGGRKSTNTPIAFIQSGYHLFTILPDGTNLQEIPLPTEGVYYPQWSPDGKHIAFDYSDLWIMDANGENPQKIMPGNHPSWNPDGQKLVFDKGNNVYIADIALGTKQLLAQDFWYPAWSPDGQTIAFYNIVSGATDVYLINADGSNLRPLTQTPDIAEYVYNNAWSPDGKYLLVTAGEKLNDTLGAPYSDNGRIEAIEVATGVRRKVVNVKFLGSVSWSPDGKRIVFSDYDNETGKLQLFIVDADGNNRRQLTFGETNSYAPAWSWAGEAATQPEAVPPAFAAILPPTPTPTPQPTATPTPTPKPVYVAPPPPCPAPGAQITSPRPGAWFTNRYNYIIGTASIPRFHHWKIEYSTNPNGGGWQYLLERDYPVENDKLVMIDASTIPRGPYGLRLTVVEDTGNYPEPCEVWFNNGY